MYELENGSARLVEALERAAEDSERLESIAETLYYYPEQLEQDIQALADYYSKARERT